MRDPSLGVREPHFMTCGWDVHACNECISHRKHLARNPGSKGERADCTVVRTRVYLPWERNGQEVSRISDELADKYVTHIMCVDWVKFDARDG